MLNKLWTKVKQKKIIRQGKKQQDKSWRQFKEFSLTKQKSRPRTMSELRKPFLKNQIKKLKKQKINVKMPQKNR